MAKKYVIYLDSRSPGSAGNNSYGYWSGKTYTVNGETFPVHTRDFITCDTKNIRRTNEHAKVQKHCLKNVLMCGNTR